MQPGLPASTAPPTSLAPAPCQNCGTALTGAYCSACGQRAHSRITSLWRLLEEAVGDIYHLDSRLWRTLLPLLVRPGQLTVEYLAGRRAQYVPPFRLYIVVSLFMFLLVWHLPGTDTPLFAPADPAALQRAIDAGEAALAQRQAALAVDSDRGAGEQRVAELRVALDELRRKQLAAGRSDRFCEQMDVTFLGSAAVEAKARDSCRKIVADRGAGLKRAFLESLPKMMFVFLPLLALVNKLLYLRSKRLYVEHLLFFVHLHVFVFVVLTLVMLGNRVLALLPRFEPPWIASATIWLAVLSYLYLALRRVYAQGRLKTLGKFGILLFAYTIGLGATTVGAVLYSALTL